VFAVKPAAAAAVAGRGFSRGARLGVRAAFLLRRGEGPAIPGFLGAFLKVGVGRIAFIKLLFVFEVNGKAAATRLENLIGPLLFRHAFILPSTGTKKTL
jgi:hypothetical protein